MILGLVFGLLLQLVGGERLASDHLHRHLVHILLQYRLYVGAGQATRLRGFRVLERRMFGHSAARKRHGRECGERRLVRDWADPAAEAWHSGSVFEYATDEHDPINRRNWRE